MLLCKICKKNLESTDELFPHIASKHLSVNEFHCPYRNCIRFYPSERALRAHLLREHFSTITNEQRTNIIPPCNEEPSCSTTNDLTCERIVDQLKYDLLHHALELLADENIARKKSLEILKKSFSLYGKAFKYMVKLNIDNSILNEFNNFFSDSSSIQSEYRLRQTLIKTGYYFESKDVTMNAIGNTNDKRILKLFSIRHMLEKLLNLPRMLPSILDYINKTQGRENEVSNIMQCKLWKTIIKTEVHDDKVLLLPLLYYFDDFEPFNVIGSHSGAYKIGGNYIGLPFLPENIVSKLEYILPIALFFSGDRDDCGNQETFSSIIVALNELSNQGISVTHSHYKRVKFIVVLVIGDNLGLNDILGFVKSFNGTYFCRFCKTPKIITQKQLQEDLKTLRNESNYREDLHISDSRLTGIVEPSAFHGLKSFHVCRNFSVDTMHDFLKGCCNYDMCGIIQNLIRKHYFTLDELNDLIKSHDYGPYVKNKSIDSITNENLKTRQIKCSASEMKVFLLNFSTMIGHKVHRLTPEWLLYIKLREVFDIISSKSIAISSFELLKSLVQEHHELYLQCFPNDHLVPKHHIMTHYSRICHMVGPLDLISSMRFESFHKKFKNIVTTTTCRKNLLTTFAKKIEFQFANFLINYENPTILNNSGIKKEMKSTYFQKYNLSVHFEKILTTKWVEVDGTIIRLNSVIRIGQESDDIPIFALIVEILFVNENEIYLCCRDIDTAGFSAHFHAYSVLLEDTYFLYKLSPTNVKKTYFLQNLNHGKFITVN